MKQSVRWIGRRDRRTRIGLALIVLGALGAACAADPGDASKVDGGTTPAPGSTTTSPRTGSSSPGSGTGSTSTGEPAPVGTSPAGTTPVGTASTGSEGGAPPGAEGGAATSPDSSAPPPTPTSLEVDYELVSSSTSQTIACNLIVKNFASATVNLADVTVRYWFTADGNDVSNLDFISYYSQTVSGNNSSDITKSVSGAFAAATGANMTTTSDAYLQISFVAAAGTLAPSGGTASVQVAVHGPGYADMFTQTNDYSYATNTSYAPSVTVTAYIGGQLVWGTEPAGTTPVVGGSAGGDAGAADTGSGGAVDSGGGAGPGALDSGASETGAVDSSAPVDSGQPAPPADANADADAGSVSTGDDAGEADAGPAPSAPPDSGADASD